MTDRSVDAIVRVLVAVYTVVLSNHWPKLTPLERDISWKVKSYAN